MGGIKSLLLLLWAGVTASTVVDVQKRIYKGVPCGPTERQFHVKITDEDDDFYCGGSLIDKQWILTAAHCWTLDMKVVLGVHPGPGIPVTIEAPPVMFGYETNRIHDIMLLKLPKPVADYQKQSPTTKIQTIDIPDCVKTLQKNDEVEVAGHTTTNSQPGQKKVTTETSDLQCLKIKVTDCPAASYQHVLCGDTSNVDTCPGDSGGGVVYGGKIYGVHVSSGRNLCTSPTNFMDVCKYKTWIEKAIKDAFKNSKIIEN